MGNYCNVHENTHLLKRHGNRHNNALWFCNNSFFSCSKEPLKNVQEYPLFDPPRRFNSSFNDAVLHENSKIQKYCFIIEEHLSCVHADDRVVEKVERKGRTNFTTARAYEKVEIFDFPAHRGEFRILKRLRKKN